MRNHVNNQEALPVMNTSTLQVGAILHTRDILESVLSELESSQVPTESIHAVLKQDRNVCSLDIRKGGTVRHVVLFSNESIVEQVDTALDFDPSMLTFIMENHDQDLTRVRELLNGGLNVNILFAMTHHSHDAFNTVRVFGTSHSEAWRASVSGHYTGTILTCFSPGDVKRVPIGKEVPG